MFAPVALFIGLRHTFSRGSGRAAPVITVAGILGLALASAVLVTVMAVMSGFEREMRERVLALVPHVTLLGSPTVQDSPALRAALAAVPGVLALAPMVRGPALLANVHGGALRSVVLEGIEPDAERRVTILDDFARPGLEVLRPGEFGLLLGQPLASELGVAVGDRIEVVLPRGRATPLGWFASQRRFTVVGLFRTQTELDRRVAFTHIDAAARLFRTRGRVTGFEIRTLDLFATARVMADLMPVAARHGLYGHDWSRTHGSLYHAIGVQKRVLFTLLVMLVAVAAFNVVSALVMTVQERRPQIAILQSMGAARRVVALAFAIQGLVMGSVGIAGGVLLGLACASVLPAVVDLVQGLTGRALLGQYLVQYLPIAIDAWDVGAVALTGLSITLAAVVYPAWRAARVPGAQVLRHE